MKPKIRLKNIFGSFDKVAEILEISNGAVSQWIKIPEKHHARLIEEAEKLGYQLTVKQLRGINERD